MTISMNTRTLQVVVPESLLMGLEAWRALEGVTTGSTPSLSSAIRRILTGALQGPWVCGVPPSAPYLTPMYGTAQPEVLMTGATSDSVSHAPAAQLSVKPAQPKVKKAKKVAKSVESYDTPEAVEVWRQAHLSLRSFNEEDYPMPTMQRMAQEDRRWRYRSDATSEHMRMMEGEPTQDQALRDRITEDAGAHDSTKLRYVAERTRMVRIREAAQKEIDAHNAPILVAIRG